MAAISLLASRSALADAPSAWEYYKSRFIQEDGRVIDVINNQISHSEGQGFSMYLALAFNDEPLFDKLWTWTRDNLMAGEAQGLAAWSWGRRPDGTWGVLDANNASDGDIFLAWTLARASERFGKGEYLAAARRIAEALRQKAVRVVDGAPVLLPGREGFVKEGETAFNPSYFIFPAFYDLARIDEPEFWRRLHASCQRLLEMSLGGPMGLPPDWGVISGGKVGPWGEKGAYFSYDAIRVPLYLSWELNRTALAGYGKLFDAFRENGELPARIPATSGASASGQAPAGFYAVLARAADTIGDGKTAAALREKADALIGAEKDDYYSHALYLLASTRGLK